MKRKRKGSKLAVLTSCMLIYASLVSIADAEEAITDDTKLEGVIVTDSQLNPLKIPVKMTVVTAEEIKSKGAQTVAEALKDVAGLSVVAGSVKGKTYGQIRGSDASSTKVIIDGVMISSVGDARVDLAMLSTDNIEKIEIIKGPVPVIYGTNAPGGVIFITTKNGSGKSSGAVSIARGSWDTDTYSASFSGATDNLNYYFGAKSQKTDGYTVHSAEESEYYNGKIKWDLNPKASLTVFGSYSESEKQFPNRINPANGQIYGYPGSGGCLSQRNSYFGGGGGPGATKDWEYDPVKQTYIGAVYNQKLDKDNDISLKVYQSTLKSLLKTSGYQSLDWDGTVNGYELQHTIRISPANTATWGYAYETRDFVEKSTNGSGTTPNGTYNRADYEYTGRSFYIQDVIKLNRKLSTSFGYRHNENTDSMTVHGPNGSIYWPDQKDSFTSNDPVFTLNYKLNESTAIHGSVGKSFRSPNVMERSAPGGTYAPLGITSSPYLLPEEGLNREVGLEYSANTGFGIDVTLFTRDITNMIKGGGGGGGRTQYYNIPDVDMHGYEVEVSQKFNDRYKAFANFTYTNAYDTRVQMQVSDTPYRKFAYGLSYTGEDGINANLAVKYVGASRSMYSEGNGNGAGDGNANVDYTNSWMTRNLPAHHVVDFRISKTQGNKEYYFTIQNLFDKDYYSGAYMIAPGRYIEAGTTIKF